MHLSDLFEMIKIHYLIFQVQKTDAVQSSSSSVNLGYHPNRQIHCEINLFVYRTVLLKAIKMF